MVAAAVIAAVVIGVVSVVVVTIVIRVVAVVVVAAVPGIVSVIRRAVIVGAAVVPVAVPTAVSPAATTTAHHGTHGHAGSERKQAGGDHIGGAVTGNDIRRPVDDSRVVLRNINNLRIGRLNDDSLRRLLHHRNLRTRLEISGGLGLRAQGLYRGHHVGSLIVIILAQLRSPGHVLRHVVENGATESSLHESRPDTEGVEPIPVGGTSPVVSPTQE